MPPTRTVLPVGTRIRHKRHPELTGIIKAHEFNGHDLSPLPYCVGWDNSSAACDALGMFFVYPAEGNVEAITNSDSQIGNE